MLIFVLLLTVIGIGLVWWLRERSVRRRRKQAVRRNDSDLGNPF